MTYENPEVPHEVNVGRENPFREFLRLAAGLALVVVALSAILYLAGGWLARLIPFEKERAWVGERVIGIEVERASSPHHQAIEAYLQRLTDTLAARMPLPEGMRIRAHYIAMDVPNAFATLGGHIVITSDLYRRMPSENALAAVIAHEIGHVRARDPISALGGSATLTMLLVLFGGDADSLAPYLASIVQRGYSRDAERAADEAAVNALRAVYGHAGGAAAVFEALAENKADESRLKLPSLLSTHPTDDERIRRLRAAAADWDATRNPLRPIEVPATATAAPPATPNAASSVR